MVAANEGKKLTTIGYTGQAAERMQQYREQKRKEDDEALAREAETRRIRRIKALERLERERGCDGEGEVDYEKSDKYFKKWFLDNEFGHVCDTCDRL